ncbi:MAG: SoxR reducing system RseC family protein [Bacteroidales bacterium]|jgi:sigma-E factor negative regulatory protein RseC|nr:SoxR reducing system RseC family protein [Bacteroidales bacterium]
MDNVEHDGIVEKIEGNILFVKILTHSACSACRAKGFCNPAETKEKIFKVKVSNVEEFSIGAKVSLAISRNQGLIAVLFGYGIPFIILILGLVFGYLMKLGELEIAAIAFSCVILYYVILFIYRKKMNNYFKFIVTKL